MGVAPTGVRWAFVVLAAWLALAALRNVLIPDLEVGPLFNRYVHDVLDGRCPDRTGDLLLVRGGLVEDQAMFAVLTTARSVVSSAWWLRQAM